MFIVPEWVFSFV